MTERELIRELRAEINEIMCFCVSKVSNETGEVYVEKCIRCGMISMIDDGLKEIGETVTKSISFSGFGSDYRYMVKPEQR